MSGAAGAAGKAGGATGGKAGATSIGNAAGAAPSSNAADGSDSELEGGCGCSTSGDTNGAVASMLAALGVLLRRRRRS